MGFEHNLFIGRLLVILRRTGAILENPSHNKQIASSPYDLTKPIMIVQAPRNDVRELNFKTSLREA